MNNHVHYSPESLSDLDETFDYISLELCNSTAAENIVNNIMGEIDKLIDFPLMGVKLSVSLNIENDYRYIFCGNYIVFYRYSNNSVYVDRILYNKRDYLRILFPVE